MVDEDIDLEEQIRRCRRIRRFLTDTKMRDALEALAEAYEARLKQKRRRNGEGFMLRKKR